MKRAILNAFFFTAVVFTSLGLNGQDALTQDQNPNYMVSRARYMKMADSLNTWHSTTFQDTYKAIDYLEDKREARLQRQAFRRELRLERARNGYGWYNGNYWYPGSFNNYNYPGYYYNDYRYNGYPYRGRNFIHRYNNAFWNSVPLALTLGWIWR
jgi:hypothetical protein